MATDGTIISQIYYKALLKNDFQPIIPQIGSELQRDIMDAIYNPTWGIKATGNKISDLAKEKIVNAAKKIEEKGAEVIIAGCTEIALAFDFIKVKGIPIINPMNIVAKLTIDLCFNEQLYKILFLKNNY